MISFMAIPFDLKKLFWCKSCGKFVAECWLRDGLGIVRRRKSCVKMEFAYLVVISACCRWMEVLLEFRCCSCRVAIGSAADFSFCGSS